MLFCPSVCLSTFYIFQYFSKSFIVTKKKFVEIGFKNCKELHGKKIFEK